MAAYVFSMNGPNGDWTTNPSSVRITFESVWSSWKFASAFKFINTLFIHLLWARSEASHSDTRCRHVAQETCSFYNEKFKIFYTFYKSARSRLYELFKNQGNE